MLRSEEFSLILHPANRAGTQFKLKFSQEWLKGNFNEPSKILPIHNGGHARNLKLHKPIYKDSRSKSYPFGSNFKLAELMQ